jgi:hypothetical protein
MKYYLRLILYLKVNEVLFEVVLYVKEVKYIDKCSVPYTLHDSLASEVGSWPMIRPYLYNLASYVARGGVRCGFIPLEVWRQRTYALHSYAFIEVIFADDVVLYLQSYEDRVPTLCIHMHTLKWYLQVLLTQRSVIEPMVFVRGNEMLLVILGLLSSISTSISDLNYDHFKMLINSIYGLNISSNNSLADMFHLPLALLNAGACCSSREVESSSTSTFTLIIMLLRRSHDLIRSFLLKDVCF